MNLLNFNNDDIMYEVNTKRKTVTAYIGDVWCDFDAVLDTPLGIALNVVMMSGIKIPELPAKFAATARCKPGEEFDVEKGKRVARLKLLRKVTQAESVHTRFIQKKFEEVTAVVADSLTKRNDNYAKRLNNIVGYLEKE